MSVQLRAGLSRAAPAVETLSRYAAAIVGGYLFAYGFTALCALAAFAAGLPFGEAQTLGWLLGFIVYLVGLLWAFTPRNSLIAWAVLGGGGAVMSVAAWTLSRAMP